MAAELIGLKKKNNLFCTSDGDCHVRYSGDGDALLRLYPDQEQEWEVPEFLRSGKKKNQSKEIYMYSLFWEKSIASNRNYSNENMQFLVGIGWVCCFIPFFAIVPAISLQLNNASPTYGEFLRIVVSGSAILLMIGVTCFSVFVHMILNKIELEKQKKFVLGRLITVLNENSVKADNPTMSTLYERYRKHNRNIKKMMNSLANGEPVNWYEPFWNFLIYILLVNASKPNY